MVRRQQERIKPLVAEALAHHRAGRTSEAEARYREALGFAPDDPLIKHNLAVLLAASGRQHEAIARFDEVVAAEPGYAAAHYNRAVALQALGRRRQAIAGFTQACALDPGNYDAHRALGFLWLAEGERGRALDHFARTYELRRGEDRIGIAAKSLEFATRGKLMHDSEQFRYLAERTRDRHRFDALARAYAEVGKGFPTELTRLSRRQLELLGDDYNTAVHAADAPELAVRAVAARTDAAAIVAKLTDGHHGIGLCDDMLTPPALHALQRYLLESTIWHDFSHIGRFVASYLEDGLACPLVMQIIDELRSTFSELLAQHPLTQAWAFKALEGDAAIDTHADDAVITVNLWLTPTSANLNDRGGLAICPIEPPYWELRGYEQDRGRAVTFLKQHGQQTVVVPYRENRGILFPSKLLHYSDSPKFAKGYTNQRINLTLLFGGKIVVPGGAPT